MYMKTRICTSIVVGAPALTDSSRRAKPYDATQGDRKLSDLAVTCEVAVKFNPLLIFHNYLAVKIRDFIRNFLLFKKVVPASWYLQHATANESTLKFSPDGSMISRYKQTQKLKKKCVLFYCRDAAKPSCTGTLPHSFPTGY